MLEQLRPRFSKILFAAVHWPDDKKGVLLAGLCFTAAFYTRQTYAMVAPLAAMIWLWQVKQRRHALQLAGFSWEGLARGYFVC